MKKIKEIGYYILPSLIVGASIIISSIMICYTLRVVGNSIATSIFYLVK